MPNKAWLTWGKVKEMVLHQNLLRVFRVDLLFTVSNVICSHIITHGFIFLHSEAPNKLTLQRHGTVRTSRSSRAGGSTSATALKNDVALDLSDVAISLANGHHVSFEDLLAAAAR